MISNKGAGSYVWLFIWENGDVQSEMIGASFALLLGREQENQMSDVLLSVHLVCDAHVPVSALDRAVKLVNVYRFRIFE